MYKDLNEFIEYLESENKLIRIKEEISTNLEMTEIQYRLIRKGGPAVLFENVVNENGVKSCMPVLCNLFGTEERVANGMGIEESGLLELGKKLSALKEFEPPKSYKDIPRMIDFAKNGLYARTKTVKNAECQQQIFKNDDVDLDMLPIQTCWPNEPAPLITWGAVVTKGPDKNDSTDDFNMGIYRMQKLSKNKLIMRWLKHRGGSQHFDKWGKCSTEPMAASVVIGSDPATILAGVTPIPDNLSEYKYAGLLRKSPTVLTECITNDIKVPQNSEIVLEGYVSFDEYEDEGPYGDHTGYYNSVERFPVFTVTAITMKKNPVYLSTFTGRAPDEPSVLGVALNQVFVPIIQKQFPEIVDFWLPPEGCSYRIAVVSIKKAYAGHAKRVMLGVWSYLRQFMYTKWVIIVDEHIDVKNWEEVWWAISTKMDPVRDITLIENTPIDYLDFASVKDGLGSKIGLDATDKIGSETEREWGVEIKQDKEVVKKIDNLFEKLKI